MTGHGVECQKRREMIRDTYMIAARPLTTVFDDRQDYKFVVGYSSDDYEETLLSKEAMFHGDFLRLQIMESYEALLNKTILYMGTVLDYSPPPKWIVILHDDVYLLPQRLPAAIKRWETEDAGYIGCVAGRRLTASEKKRDWVKASFHLAKTPYRHAAGPPIFALSKTAALFVRETIQRYLPEPPHLYKNPAMLQALGDKVKFLQDPYMCKSVCGTKAVAVWMWPCGGACLPLSTIRVMNTSETCWSAEEDTSPEAARRRMAGQAVP